MMDMMSKNCRGRSKVAENALTVDITINAKEKVTAIQLLSKLLANALVLKKHPYYTEGSESNLFLPPRHT